MKIKICEVEICDRVHYARGYCRAHWTRIHKLGNLNPSVPIRQFRKYRPKSTRRCSVDGCREKHRAKGYCMRHYGLLHWNKE